MPIIVSYIIAIITAIAGTVLAFIFIVPEKKREKLPGFLKFLHDLFNLRFLIIESILKALYIFNTILCIVLGFFMLFSGTYTWGGFVSSAPAGIVLLISGPIIARLLYEGCMLLILLVKNTMQINRKLKSQTEDGDKDAAFGVSFRDMKNDYGAPAGAHAAPVASAAPVAPAAPAEDFVFCTQCGTKYDQSKGNCPNCGSRNE